MYNCVNVLYSCVYYVLLYDDVEKNEFEKFVRLFFCFTTKPIFPIVRGKAQRKARPATPVT